MSSEFTKEEIAELVPDSYADLVTVNQIIAKSGFDTVAEGDISATADALRTAVRLAEPLDRLDRVCLQEMLIKKLEILKIRNRAKIVGAAFQIYERSGTPPVSTATLQQSPASHISANELEVLHGCCRELSMKSNILDRVAEVMHSFGIAGEDRVLKLTYLSITARLLNRPASLIIKGPSSVGKSYPVQKMLKLFPPSAYYALTGMSEHGLVYLTEPMSHRTLILYEATGFESDEYSYFLRSLLSEGRLSYQTNEKGADGKISSRLVILEGPTGLITTTTAVNLHPENETRALSILANDSPEQTRAVMLAQAEEIADLPDTSPFVALQEWLQYAEHRVTIPFAQRLANLIPPVAVRLRRDFPTILTLIRANAVLHQATRQRDSAGQVIADPQDYETVRQLVSEAIGSQVDATVQETVRQTVEAVTRINGKTRQPVCISELKKELNLDKSTISRRVKVALGREYLQNEEKHRGRPFRLIPGDPLPPATEILPSIEALHSGSNRCSAKCNTYLIDVKEDTGKCCSVAPKTEGTVVTANYGVDPLEQRLPFAERVPQSESTDDWMAGTREFFKLKREKVALEKGII